VRASQNGSDPERTERQLRAARAVSDAIREGRVLDGFCLQPPAGFRIADALTVYGGLSVVEQACHACPANATDFHSQTGLAGCYGILPVTDALHAAAEACLHEKTFAQRYEQILLPANPHWYGLWAQSPLTSEQASLCCDLFSHIAETTSDAVAQQFHAALVAATQSQLPMHVLLFPSGRVEGTLWRLAAHCPRCKAEWTNEQAMSCGICGLVGQSAPQKKRKARGPRPYVMLDRLLGAAKAEELLFKYEQCRAMRPVPAQVESPLAEAPPDSLPAG
jgi:hypothetical protein